MYSKDSIFNAYGEGILLSRPAFDKNFAEFVNSKGVRIEVNARVNHLRKSKKGWLVEYARNEDIKELRADFVIDATGRNTKFASTFGIKKNKYDNLIGVTFFCTPKNKAHIQKGKILIEAVKKGWWYSTVLMDDILVVTFMTDADIIEKSGVIEDALQYFIASSNQTKSIVAKYQRTGKVHTVSAKSQIVSQLTGDNWMMVGDSAWSIDPLSSQGIYKAMAMGLGAAEAINGHFSENHSALDNYNSHFKEMFFSYIKLRAKYYRMETRWCEEDFWKRRHKPCWLEIPVSIDPAKKISFSSKKYHDNSNELKLVAPSVDESLLSNILELSTSAFDAASDYKKQSEHSLEDKEVIIAIQEMLKHDATQA